MSIVKKSFFPLVICLPLFGLGQRKEMDFAALQHWPVISNQAISADGRYVVYEIRSDADVPLTVLQASDNSWKKEMPNATGAVIARDGSRVIFHFAQDSIGIFTLPTRELAFMGGIKSFKVPHNGKGNWMAIQLKGADSMVLLNLEDRKQYPLPGSIEYTFSPSGELLLLHVHRVGHEELVMVDLPSLRQKKITTSSGVLTHTSFDATGRQLCFIRTDVKGTAICYYRPGLDSAIVIADSTAAGIPAGYGVDDETYDYPRFSKDGTRIFFSLVKKPSIDSMQAPVIIWRGSDAFLASERAKGAGQEDDHRVAIVGEVPGEKVIPLTIPGDRDCIIPHSPGLRQVLVCRYQGNSNEGYWRMTARKDYWLVSIDDGSRKAVVKGLGSGPYGPAFSSGGRYLIWYDPEKMRYFSYELSSGKTADISAKMPSAVWNEDNDVGAPPEAYGVAGWGPADGSVFLYDKFDLWEVNADGNGKPRNVTEFFGRKNKLCLRHLNLSDNYDDVPVFQKDQPILCWSYDSATKDNGLYRVQNGSLPVKLSSGPYQYGFLFKAADAQACLLTRMAANEYPNVYLTSDFKELEQLSQLAPQRPYRWYTSTLMRWQMPDGKTSAGVLYKPTDFDPHKKYPVIFSLYEKNSGQLNVYLSPGPSTGDLNIPWFVNHDYLVFIPDIEATVGIPGRSAVNTVVSAARWLCTFPWVDSTRLGLHGHSFGGFETNYIITKTGLFAAASSAAGVADMPSLTHNIRYGTGESAQWVSEMGQMRMGRTLWQDPEEYRLNSPLYGADRVITPLLILHNDQDEAVPWSQGIEWFTALRRLNKAVWMLQYPGETHTLEIPSNQLDYTTRLQQFFDHYLKGAPLPSWMASGNK